MKRAEGKVWPTPPPLVSDQIKRYIVCYFCGEPATDGDYCYGCKHYVCQGCHETDIIGLPHTVENHMKKPKDFWLISDETYQKVIALLELSASPGVYNLDKKYFRKVLHELETGVHRTDAVPGDEEDVIDEPTYNEVLADLERD